MVEWVTRAIGADRVAPWPSAAHRSLYRWAEKHQNEFFRNFVARLIGTGDDEESKRERRREAQDAMAIEAMLMRMKEEAERDGRV
jgi:hypothetical protein